MGNKCMQINGKELDTTSFFYNYMLHVYLILMAYAKTVFAYGFFQVKTIFLTMNYLFSCTCLKVGDNSLVE